MRILALASYPPRMASTRFRISRYIPHLAARGIDVELVPWLDDASAARLYDQGGKLAAIRSGARGAGRQIAALGERFDAVWVQREALLAGPPLVEALAFLRRIPLVLDYDDAVWIAQGSALKRAAKFAWKFDWVLRRAQHAIAGSHSLAEHARALGVPATVLPTVVDRATWTPRKARDVASPALVIGWIGTHSTASQLDLALPALRRLRDEGHQFRVEVVGAGDTRVLDGLTIERRPWSQEREIDDFRSLDIGLAPMHHSPWHEGKCAFKQLQYMAVGVPCVSSLVGGARDFVRHDENALVAETEEDWYVQLRRLLTDAALRARLAKAGRELVETDLCTEAQAESLANVMRGVAQR